MFLIAAIYNWIAGVSIMILSIFFLPLTMSITEMEAPPTLVFVHSFLAFIIVFGIGFCLVSIDIDKYHAIAIIGVIEKYVAVLIWAIYIIIGEAGTFALSIIIGDFIFGCLFLEFLINRKKIQ